MSKNTNAISIINFVAATKLVDHAIRHAHENNWNVAVVVVDPWGAIVAAGRMDGVAAPILEFAQDKAYTATLGRTSKGFYERMSSSADLTLGLQNRPRLCAWEGGIPIKSGDELVGAIGVSGAEGKDDAACAKEALKTLGFSVED